MTPEEAAGLRRWVYTAMAFSRFSSQVEVLASTVSRLERDLALGQSLFDRYPHVVVSTDFIKSTRHRDDFVGHCPDLVIVDEAHTCVAADDADARRRTSCATSCCARSPTTPSGTCSW